VLPKVAQLETSTTVGLVFAKGNHSPEIVDVSLTGGEIFAIHYICINLLFQVFYKKLLVFTHSQSCGARVVHLYTNSKVDSRMSPHLVQLFPLLGSSPQWTWEWRNESQIVHLQKNLFNYYLFKLLLLLLNKPGLSIPIPKAMVAHTI